MDSMQILLLALVGLSALVFLILDTFDSHQSSKHRVIARRGEGEKRLGSEGNRISDDEWEGVERSELEKIFGEALVYAESCQSIGEDSKLQLYGLQKAALQGPCCGSRPTALHLSARSKWNAWQKVGNISEEIAMEKYIATLSDLIPDWNKGERDEAES
ncbi:hypothetical protein SASPL_138084 [Salvia splendens]|uniref:ACB domain-containing protein n=1 Tax=Salvia splendens TaxID=180675 RepID=A0A8X8ZEN3_SALSN|nr:acyl-CoA-binding domain-containing protein 3-like [Salvia splendens]KAG6401234.1 hypothetical protein SASPL_138084 [Salvia splendens]